MSKFIPFALISLLILSTLPSCRKVFDYIKDHHDAHDTLCRITQIRVRGYFGHPDTVNITYDAKGNPISMLLTSPPGSVGNLDQYFRYDRYGRLSDYFWSYIKAKGVIVWHKYGYPRKNFITDTVMQYTGMIDEPSPIAGEAQFGYGITGYTMDAHDRISKIWSVPKDPHQPPQLGGNITYDANGNLPISDSGVVYDNEVNPYRTSKTWQFVFQDYSRNNRVLTGIFAPVPTYNDFGLPVALPNLNLRNFILFFLSNTDPAMTITYACPAPKGPIDY